MVALLFIGGIASALLVIITSLILWRLQRNHLRSLHVQQQAWQRAQEMHGQQWEVLQEKYAHEANKKVSTQVQQIRDEWKAWEARDAARVESLAQQYATAEQRSHVESELARLPYIETIPFSFDTSHPWQPPQLRGANLAHRDLSHRYLGKADLRNANLAHTNLFMTDLSEANLAGANLTGADLSGVNFTHADLHDATLVEATLLVADLNETNLNGANLLGVHGLTIEQLRTATYDNTTQLDLDIDITLHSVPIIGVFDTPIVPTSKQEIAPSASPSINENERETPLPPSLNVDEETPVPPSLTYDEEIPVPPSLNADEEAIVESPAQQDLPVSFLHISDTPPQEEIAEPLLDVQLDMQLDNPRSVDSTRDFSRRRYNNRKRAKAS